MQRSVESYLAAMEQVFVPVLYDSYRWMSLCATVGLAGVVVAVLAFRQKTFPVRPVSQLVGMLFGLVGLAGSALILWDIARTPTVVVAEDYLIIANDSLPPSRVVDAYIEPVADGGVVGEQATRDLGIVKLDDGTVHLFTDKQYDVKRLIGAIRQAKE